MRRNFTGFISAFVMCGLATSSLGAEPPKEVEVRYLVRQTPSDPNSAVVFDVQLHLSAQSWTGHTVDWRIDEVVISRVSGGSGSWSKASPTTEVWSVTHADLESPRATEFTSVPSINGLAAAADPADPDLRFSMTGRSFSPPSSMYAGRVSQMDYNFTLADEEEPEEEGEEEPVEVDTPSF